MMRDRKSALEYVHDEVSSVSDILAELSFKFRKFRDDYSYKNDSDCEVDSMIIENLQTITAAINNIKDLTEDEHENSEDQA